MIYKVRNPFFILEFIRRIETGNTMTIHIHITGRVQGVGFRHFTRKNAQSLNLKGWVMNLPDGRVEALISGEKENVQQLLNRLQDGPPAAYVQKIDKKKADDTPRDLPENFEVRYS